MNKPLRILILDNNRENDCFGSKELVRLSLASAPIGSEVQVRRPPGQDLPINLPYDALVISGSITSCLEKNEPWIRPYDEFVTEQIRQGKPILGVCYGHQTLARCLFRLARAQPKLGVAKDAELGWTKIEKVEETPLYESLSDGFYTYQSHYEEISELPPGTKHTGRTDRCEIQSFEVFNKPIFGVQYHPEYEAAAADEMLAAKLKKGIRKDWILHPGKSAKLYDPRVGLAIFGNFFKIASEHRAK